MGALDNLPTLGNTVPIEVRTTLRALVAEVQRLTTIVTQLQARPASAKPSGQ